MWISSLYTNNSSDLPQVAYEVKWDKEESISHCAHDKLGLGWTDGKMMNYMFTRLSYSESSAPISLADKTF